MFRDIGLATDAMIREAERIRKGELDKSIAKLRSEMDEAISREDYERAAELRDMLAPLVGDCGGKNDG
jgi:protein-arginine kinase activator protein McsA